MLNAFTMLLKTNISILLKNNFASGGLTADSRAEIYEKPPA